MGIDVELLKREYDEAVKAVESGEFWVPKTGENRVRILPPSAREKSKIFYREVHVHYGVEGLGMVFCLQNWGEKCPVCEFINKLKDLNSVEAVNLAKRITQNKRYLVNIIDLNEANTTGMYVIKQWLAPKTVRLDLLKIVLDADWGDITDLATGRDVIIDRSEKQGGAKYVDYTIRPKPDRRRIDVITEEDIPAFDEILDKRMKDYITIRTKMFGEEEVEGAEVERYFKKMQERSEGKQGGSYSEPPKDIKTTVTDNQHVQSNIDASKEELMKKALEMLQGAVK